MSDSIKARLRSVLPRDLPIDLEDRLRAESVKAFEMIRDHSGLDAKRAREAEGQARFRMWEQGFEDVCTLNGGQPLSSGVIPNTDLKIHQPFMRFEVDGKGVILGLASMPEIGKLPGKNKSRTAGVSLNYDLSLRLDLPGVGPSIGDVFAVFLVSRDRGRAGKIEEIAIGVIDSAYENFLYYESIDGFLGGEEEGAPVDRPMPPAISGSSAIKVTLKDVVTRFVPPELPKPDEEDSTGGGG